MKNEINIGDIVIIPKGTEVSQWGGMVVTKRDRKVKVFRQVPLDETSAGVIGHGRWETGTVVVQFFDKSVLNAARKNDVRRR